MAKLTEEEIQAIREANDAHYIARSNRRDCVSHRLRVDTLRSMVRQEITGNYRHMLGPTQFSEDSLWGYIREAVKLERLNESAMKSKVTSWSDIIQQSVGKSTLGEVSSETYAKIEPSMRTYMPRKDSDPPRVPSDTSQKVGAKPKGLWYSLGTAWVDWVRSEMPKWESNIVYKLDIDDSRILKINSLDEIQDFANEFGVKIRYSENYVRISIDWPAVAKKYSGIEISPYQYDYGRSDEGLWHYDWDVASGCIWDPGVLKGYTNLSDPDV